MHLNFFVMNTEPKNENSNFSQRNEYESEKPNSQLRLNINEHDKLSLVKKAGEEHINKREKINSNIRKAKITKESTKRYRVFVRYIEVGEDERKIKRAIIEDILKKSQ